MSWHARRDMQPRVPQPRNAWAAERLTREPGWVIDAALTHSGDGKVFAAYLHSASSREIVELRLGKKAEQLYEQAEKLHMQLDRYANGPPQIRFTDDDVDQARVAGVLIEFDGPGRPIIVDRQLYRELVKTAIKRTHDDLEAKAAAAAKDKKATRSAKQPADPVAVAKRERDAQLREVSQQSHGANLDLGHALIHNLTSVDPTGINVARFFVLCGLPHRTNYADGFATPRRVRRARAAGTVGRLLEVARCSVVGISAAVATALSRGPRRRRSRTGACGSPRRALARGDDPGVPDATADRPAPGVV
jgi:hypothetical protein